MTNSKKTKRYQFWINLILIVMTLTIILPFLLVFISSITDETVLIRNGYSFFPEKISFYAYQYIIRQELQQMQRKNCLHRHRNS